MKTFAATALPVWMCAASAADPHVHGQAFLSVSADESRVLTEFTIDQYTLVGFEGAPSSATRKSDMEKALEAATTPGMLFDMETSVPCLSQRIELSERKPEGAFGEDSSHHDDHHGRDHDAHADSHRDIVISEVFQCQKPATVKAIKVHAFSRYPLLETVRVVVLTDSQQEERVVTRSRNDAVFP